MSLRNCTIREVTFGDVARVGGVSFSNCLITRVCGAANVAGLPKGMVSDDCEIEAFDNMATNSAVLQLDIAPQMKALITVLCKLYKQPGAGRKLGAFSRGITRPEVLRYVNPVLDILQHHQFISIFNLVVHPVRKQASRVEQILAAPMLVDDALVVEIKALP